MNSGGISNIGLGFVFGARDLASGPINALRGNFSQLQTSVVGGVPRIAMAFGALAASVAMVATGLAGIRGAWEVARGAGEFGMAMADVASVTGATAREFDALHEAAIRAGILTQFAPQAAAEGLENLASNGAMANDAIRALIPTLDLAAAGGISVADAADIGMSVLNAYGMNVDQMASVNDRLMRGTQLTALRASEFLAFMGRAASTGNMFGQSLDDVVIALGSMRNAGIPAEVAGTSLGEAMRRVYTETDVAAQLQQQFGIAIADSAGNLRSIIDIAHELELGMQGMTEAERARIVTEIFHVRGMQQFNAIAHITAREMRDGRDVTMHGAEAIAYYRREMGNASGVTAEFRDRRLATFQGSLVLLGGTLQTLGVVIGEVFGVIFRPMVVLVTDAINRFIEVWTSIPVQVRQAIGVLFLVGSSLLVVGGTIGVVVSALVLLIGFFGELFAIATAVGAGMALALLPITGAIAGVMAVGYALYRAWQANLGGLQNFTARWAENVRLLFTGLSVSLSGGGDPSWVIARMRGRGEHSLAELLRSIDRFVNRAREFWGGLREGFSEAWDQIGPQLAELRESMDRMMGTAVESGTALMNVASDRAGNNIRNVGAQIGSSLGVALGSIAHDMATIADATTQVMALFDSPTWQAFAYVLDTIAFIAESVYRVFHRLYNISLMLNPIQWLAAGVQWMSGEEVRAQPALMAEGWDADTEMFTGPREVARPAAPSARPGPFRGEETEGRLGRRGGMRPIDLRNHIVVELDGRVLDEQERTRRIQQGGMNGELSADFEPSMGAGRSVPGR